MKRYYFLLVVAVLSSCSRGKGAKDVQDYTVSGDTITVSVKSPLISKIKTSQAMFQDYNPLFTASGEVESIPTKYAQVASPFAGRIVKSFVRLGQKVRAGCPIFEISSAAFFESVKEYCQAQEQVRAAYVTLRREKDLVRNKVGAKKEEEDAALDYGVKKKELENAKAALSVYHMSPRQMSLGRPLVVRSPITGEIVKSTIVTGQYLKDDADPVATVANLDEVWMVAHVKEKDINLIRNLSTVGISLISMPDKEIRGKIYHIGQMMDEDTHSVEVIIECNNKARLMKPGMYGYVKLSDKAVKKIMIPSSSVLQEENSQYVFVKVGSNKYVKREVTTTAAPNNQAVVLSGLNPNDEIITEGAFYLNNIL